MEEPKLTIEERLRRGPEDALDAVDTMNEAADEIDRLKKVIRSGINMRYQQRAYLKKKSVATLTEAKKAERSFDRMAWDYSMGFKPETGKKTDE